MPAPGHAGHEDDRHARQAFRDEAAPASGAGANLKLANPAAISLPIAPARPLSSAMHTGLVFCFAGYAPYASACQTAGKCLRMLREYLLDNKDYVKSASLPRLPNGPHSNKLPTPDPSAWCVTGNWSVSSARLPKVTCLNNGAAFSQVARSAFLLRCSAVAGLVPQDPYLQEPKFLLPESPLAVIAARPRSEE